MAVFLLQIIKTKDGSKIKEEKEIIIEVGTSGPGSAKSLSADEIDLRRFLGLPIKKDLFYYPSSREDIKRSVDKFEIDEIYTITEPWFTLTLYMGNDTVKIHHSYFAEMQSPTFVSDMQKMSDED